MAKQLSVTVQANAWIVADALVISRVPGGQSDVRGRCAGASDERGGSTFDAATVKISREWGMERGADELVRGGLPRGSPC
ncbi:MAG: hypothetical protein ACJ780_15760 [Solirubrobacteraceae bacterium]